MAWIEGNQIRPVNEFANINDEIAKIEGFIEEDEAKLLLYKFFRHNITYATNVFMGVKLFPFQHLAIKTMLDTDYTLNVWSRGLSKSFSCGIYAVLDAIFNQGIQIGILSAAFRQCPFSDSLCKTKSGLKKIKDLQVGEEILARHGWQKILNKWKNEPAQGLRVTTKKGYSIKGKNEHKILTYLKDERKFKYKEIIDLKIGDLVPISMNDELYGEDVLRNFDYNSNNCHRSKKIKKIKNQDDFFYMIGSFIGDGYFRSDRNQSRFEFVSGDKESIDWMENFIQSILPDNIINRDFKKNKDGQKTCTEFLTFNSNELGNIFKFIGYEDNKNALTKEVPEKVFQSKKSHIASFMRGLMDTDGTAVFKSKSKEVTLATSSKELAKQFQLLLLNFGIISKLGSEKAKGEMEICGIPTIGRESYKVRITGYQNIKKYHENIGFSLSRKSKAVEEYLKECKSITKNRGIVIPGIGEYLGKKYKGNVDRNKNWTKEKLLKHLNSGAINDPEDIKLCQSLIDEEVYFDSVSELSERDEVETYDIEVENEHCYWGNGFINHNSKQIFRKIEDIASKPEAALLNQLIGNRGISKGNDEWILKIGDSTIRALPLGDGSKLRGFRFHRIIIDEMLLMPERIYNEVILPFLAVTDNPDKQEELAAAEDLLIEKGEMKEEDRYKWPNNKLIALSSASYKFEYLYKFYKTYENLITNPDWQLEDDEGEEIAGDTSATRAVIQLSYDCAPRKLYDKNLIKQSVATMSQSQFDREFGAKFTDDSSGYFKISRMADCTIPYGESPSVEIFGDPDGKYILAFDPSWAENDSSDDFAIHLFKLNDAKKMGTVVHSYALSDTRLKEHMNYFLYLIKHFNIVAMIGDSMGGVSFINACNESKLFKDEGIEIGLLDVNFDKLEEYKEALEEAKNQYNPEERIYCHLQTPTSGWIRRANEHLQGCFDHKKVKFAAEAVDSDFAIQKKAKIPIADLKFRNQLKDEELAHYEEDMKDSKSKIVEFIEHQNNMIDLIKAESALIQINTSPQGHQTFDLPKNLRNQSGPNKTRKDSYSAMVLGNWMVKLYYDFTEAEEQNSGIFMPRFLK